MCENLVANEKPDIATLTQDIKAVVQQMIREAGFTVKRGEAEIRLTFFVRSYIRECQNGEV